MAKQQVLAVGLLPSRRVVRVATIDVKMLQEITRRIGRKFPPRKPGEAPYSEADLSIAFQNEQVAMCVRGVVKKPVEMQFKTRPVTEAEKAQQIAAAKAAGLEAPTEFPDVKEVDVEAMLRPYTQKDSDEFKRWSALNEQSLTNEEDDDCMFTLFGKVGEWKALVGLINESEGGSDGANPFAGRLLKTSAG